MSTKIPRSRGAIEVFIRATAWGSTKSVVRAMGSSKTHQLGNGCCDKHDYLG